MHEKQRKISLKVTIYFGCALCIIEDKIIYLVLHAIIKNRQEVLCMKKRTNKLLSTLLSLALLLGIFAPGFTVYAGVVDSGDCGDNVAWSLDDGGVMTISVKDATQPGEMTDYVSSSDTPWYSHLGDVTSVIVKEGVTKVGNRAFDSAINVETVSLPKGLKTIGDSAFFGIEKLKEVDLPEGLVSL